MTGPAMFKVALPVDASAPVSVIVPMRNVEATLAQMGDALQKGESLNLPAFGKVRVARAGSEAGGAMTLKMRQGTGGAGKGKAAKEPIADAEDQD